MGFGKRGFLFGTALILVVLGVTFGLVHVNRAQESKNGIQVPIGTDVRTLITPMGTVEVSRMRRLDGGPQKASIETFYVSGFNWTRDHNYLPKKGGWFDDCGYDEASRQVVWWYDTEDHPTIKNELDQFNARVFAITPDLEQVLYQTVPYPFYLGHKGGGIRICPGDNCSWDEVLEGGQTREMLVATQVAQLAHNL